MFAERNRLQLRPSGEAQCPLCREEILDADTADERLFECGGCETVYHLECAIEMSGCATLGCVEQGRRPKREESGRFAVSDERRRELRREAMAELARRARRVALQEPGPLLSRRLGKGLAVVGFLGVLLALVMDVWFGISNTDPRIPPGFPGGPTELPAWVEPTWYTLTVLGVALLLVGGGIMKWNEDPPESEIPEGPDSR